jgi:hypothetical protein
MKIDVEHSYITALLCWSRDTDKQLTRCTHHYPSSARPTTSKLASGLRVAMPSNHERAVQGPVMLQALSDTH